MDKYNLRLGNYLQDDKGRLCVVEKLGTDWNENGIEAPALIGGITSHPVHRLLITKQWLLNFGFKNITESGVDSYLEFKLEDFVICSDLSGWNIVINDRSIYINYIDELQNFHFILTGEELKI